MIRAIFSLPYARHLAFKGGTLCYFLYGLDRFSTDIDLDVLDGLDGSLDVYGDIAKLAWKYGQVKRKKHLLVSYEAWYHHIKVDLSRKIWKESRYEIVNFYGKDIQVQDRWTIFAHKLVASLERDANRDLYDVFFFLKHEFPLYEEIVVERTGGWLDLLWKALLEKIDALGDGYKILDGLGEVLDTKQKTFVKNHLLNELRWLVQLRLDFYERG